MYLDSITILHRSDSGEAYDVTLNSEELNLNLVVTTRKTMNYKRLINLFLTAIIVSLLIIDTRAQGALDTLAYLKDNKNIYAIVISKDDKVIEERYYNHYDSTSLFNNQSITKSICSILVGIAIDNGSIKSADGKLVNYFPELNDDPDKRKRDITIRHVLNQASGLYHEDLSKLHQYLDLPNPSAHALKAPLVSEPGKLFHYNNAASHLISLLITKSTGMATHVFAKKFLFDPLGITAFEWRKMRDGYDDGSGLISVQLRTADLIKLGRLLLRGGNYNGQQIVSKDWVQQIISPAISYQTDWGFDNSTYSLCWYSSEHKGKPITYAMGWGGQFLIVIPSINAVVAINQNTADETAIKQSINFINIVFPAIYKQLLSEN